MAAVLACGPGAVLSHGSAATLWGYLKYWDEPFEVTVALDRRPKDIRVHRCHLTPADKTRQEGIPVTTPARTVLDCAPNVANPTRLVNDALHSPWLTEGQLVEAMERHPRAALVRQIVLGQRGITHSDLEDKFVRFLKRFGIKQPELNVPIDGRVVDAFFREEGVIVELDGYEFHKDRATFSRDREKDAEAIANGLIPIRITEDRLTEEEARRLTAILHSRRR
jgi:very-short-patch-repair endonuclease